MNKTLRKFFVAAASVLLAAVSCHRRPLLDPSELVTLRVTVNTDSISNVTSDIYNPNLAVPTTNTDMMRVLLYSPSTGRLVSQSFISSKSENERGEQVLSGNLNISHGNFDLIVYNFDTPWTQVQGENNENDAVAYTAAIPESMKSKYSFSKALGVENIPITHEPDHFMVARERGLRISPHDEITTVETTSHTIIDTYYLQVRIAGARYVSEANAVISGLSPSNVFALNERTLEPSSAVTFNLQTSTDNHIAGDNKDVLCGLFNTFGKLEDVRSDLLMTFNVTDVAGNLLQFDFNLDRAFRTQDAIEHNWLLLDTTIVIPNPNPNPTPSGGFQPEVGDWETQHGEILL